MTRHPIKTLAGALALTGASLAGPAQAADAAYPSRPVRIVVDFPAGGTIDVLARIMAQQLSEAWKQPVVVENHPGAGGNIGAQMVFDAAPDGYTLLATPPGPLAINQYLYKKLAFDPTRFAPVSMLAASPNVVSMRADLPVHTLQELIAYAKAHPGKLSYGSQGNGSTSHLTGQLFATLSGSKLVHVPYKGEGPALTDLMAGRIDLFMGNISAVLKLREAGKVRIVAVAGSKRTAMAPDIPTSDEQGFKDFYSSAWFAMAAPPGTPAAITGKINAAVTAALNKDEVRKKFLGQGAEAMPSTPAHEQDFIAAERVRWQKVIADAQVTLD